MRKGSKGVQRSCSVASSGGGDNGSEMMYA